ncbi:MAG: MlaD family protein [Candidatus Methylomirabilota bacterium]
MSKSLIGAFVVGAIALLVVAIAIFGSGKFLAKRPMVVMFFQGSVKGLNAGAPVLFRGVPIGSVKEIDIVADPQKRSTQIPVYAEIDPERIKYIGEKRDPVKELDRLIQAGLRAELETQSLVTGQLAINLDYFPDTTPVLVGADPRYPEIPTKPTELHLFLQKLETLPIDELVRNLNDTVVGINQLVRSPELTATVRNLSEFTKDLKPFLANLDRGVAQLVSTIDQTVKEYGQVARDADRLVNDVDKEVPAIASGLKKTLEDVQATLAQARQTLVKAENFLADDGEVEYELTQTMSEISRAARSIRQLADVLRQNPDSLIWGRKASGGR